MVFHEPTVWNRIKFHSVFYSELNTRSFKTYLRRCATCLIFSMIKTTALLSFGARIIITGEWFWRRIGRIVTTSGSRALRTVRYAGREQVKDGGLLQKKKEKRKIQVKTRTHYSRMRTTSLFTVSRSIPCIWGGVCPLMQNPLYADPRGSRPLRGRHPWMQITREADFPPVEAGTHE